MNSKINKAVFFFRQLSLSELFFLMLYRIKLFKSNNKLKDKYIVFNHFYKNGTDVIRKGLVSEINIRVNDLNFKIHLRRNTSDLSVFRQILIKNEFENVLKIFYHHNFSPKRIIDTGANIGLVSIYLKAYFPEVELLLIEPNKKNFNILCGNLKMSPLFEKDKLINSAIWSSNQKLEIDIEEKGNEWGFKLKKAGTKSTDCGLIEAYNFHSILKNANWEIPDYIKIDVEGAEEEIFKDDDFLNSILPRLKAITIEIHSHKLEKKIEELLETNSFIIYKTGELLLGIKDF